MDSPGRAAHLLAALVRGGMREVVLAPGSRNGPLSLALYAADAVGDLRLHVRVDERSAGFLALGLATGSREPVAVVTTSGTAVGNLLPAVMEAAHSGRRLVVVSADRPHHLRGTGANQTTEQDGLFGSFAATTDLGVDQGPADLDAAAAAAVAHRGPTHLNLQLDEPLLPDTEPWWPGARTPDRPRKGWRTTDPDDAEVLARGPRTVVVAGDDSGSAARILAERAGWPLLAEPTSGARVGPNAVRTYRLLLAGPLRADIERVVVLGHPTLSRPVTRLISDPALEVVAAPGPGGVVTDPGRVARHLTALPTAPTGPATPADLAWLHRWQRADAGLSAALDDLVDDLPELDALHVAREVAAAVVPWVTLVVGSSNAVRDLDLMTTPYPPHGHRFVVGNRGLAGIDGLVSTATGIALGRPDASRTTALLGDLTFLHDLGGLVVGRREPRADLTLVVVNDGGGSIFSTLEPGAAPYATALERVFATPVDVDLESLCRATHTGYARVTSVAELRSALAESTTGTRVLEARVDRSRRRATDAAIRALGEDWGR